MTTNDAFVQAKKLLDKRYGNHFVLGNAFRDKLDSWPKVPSCDGKALRNLADFMRQCRAAMENIGHLAVLNDEREHRKILAKLPDWLINRWARKVSDLERKVPPISLPDSLKKKLIYHAPPLTSLQGMKIHETKDNTCTNRHEGTKAFRARPQGRAHLHQDGQKLLTRVMPKRNLHQFGRSAIFVVRPTILPPDEASYSCRWMKERNL